MIQLHEYQETARDKALAELDRAEAALVVMPTATGKSYTGVSIASEIVRRGGRVLILCHRKELLEQWGRSCDAFGINWAIEQAEQRAQHETLHGRVDVVLGSKDTLQGKRLDKWSPHTFSLIIADECHRSCMKTWLNVFGHFHSARRLGLTATPERTDEETIQTVFGNVAYELPFWEAVEKQYITAPIFKRPAVPIDLSALRKSGDDLNQGDLEDTITEHISELVNLAMPEINGSQTMVFTPRVHSAAAMAAGFSSLGIRSGSVHGQSEDRDLVVKQFRDHEVQLLASCDLLREGADFPSVSCLVMARPTTSGLVYRQMLGRGLRKHPGKTHVTVVDYSWNSGKHDLFEPIDLFDATGMDLDVLHLAGKLMKEGKEQDVRRAIDEAERIHKAEVALKIQVQERTPRYKMLAFDPFQVGSLLGVPNRQREGQKPCTQRTIERLAHFKLDVNGMSNGQAQKLLVELERRRSEGYCSHRQVALLVSKHVPPDVARSMTFEEAAGDLDILVGERKRA